MPPSEGKRQANPTRASTLTSLPLFLTCQPGSLKDAAGHSEPRLRAARRSPVGSAQPPRCAQAALAANPAPHRPTLQALSKLSLRSPSRPSGATRPLSARSVGVGRLRGSLGLGLPFLLWAPYHHLGALPWLFRES